MGNKPIKAAQCKYMPTDKNTVVIHTTKRGEVYEVGFTIGNQHFTVQERETKKEAQWFCDMLETAFNTLIIPQYIHEFKSQKAKEKIIENLNIKVINKRLKNDQKERQLKLGFGALVPKISTQLRKQGFKYDKDKVKLFEKCLDSILYLMFNDFLSDKQIDRLYDKLRKKIVAHVKLKNQQNGNNQQRTTAKKSG